MLWKRQHYVDVTTESDRLKRAPSYVRCLVDVRSCRNVHVVFPSQKRNS